MNENVRKEMNVLEIEIWEIERGVFEIAKTAVEIEQLPETDEDECA
jgi:hypothetical protein